MASGQPQPARPWFRLASLARPPAPPPTTPTPEPPAPPPPTRPPVLRPTFRPLGQPQPQEPIAPPPTATGVSSVPNSPIRRTSVPNSPVQKTSPPPSSSVLSRANDHNTSSVTASPIVHRTSPTNSPPPNHKFSPSPSPSPRNSSSPKPSTYSSMPSSPAKKQAPYTSSVATSPPKPFSNSPTMRTLTTSNNVTNTTRVPSPTRSPRTFSLATQTPPQSPKLKPTAPPPSPLILPPAQARSNSEHDFEPKIPTEAEQKTVLVHEKPKTNWFSGGTGSGSNENHHQNHNSNWPSNNAHHVKHEMNKEDHYHVETKKKDHQRKKFTSDNTEKDKVGMRVITIAGENKGAFMEVIKSPMKHAAFDGPSHSLHEKGNPKTDQTGWHSYSSSSEEAKNTNMNHRGKAMVSPSSPMGAYMNSNVQGVNNSIVYNSSCSHHDPGVHLALSRKPSSNGFHVKENGNGHHYS